MTRLILPTQEQWSVLEALGIVTTAAPSMGIVLVAPHVTEALTKEGGDLKDTLELRYINIQYDNGGEPDVMLDIIATHEHYGINQLRVHANLPEIDIDDEEELLEMERDWVEFDMDWDDGDDEYDYPTEEHRWDDDDDERVSFTD